ncbi:MAG: hypothetical protein C0504_05520 [Candidatus Solibacter sp.]|nr:hypothetical protein [Candidatus Solibacter sp.]
MIAELTVAAALAQCVPMRWPAGWAAADLARLEGTVFNCVVAERAEGHKELVEAAKARGILVAAVKGSAAEKTGGAGAGVVEIRQRGELFSGAEDVLATGQGLWPGIRVEKDGKAEARPTGGPWVETNTGFLRYARAAAPGKAVWIANRAPAGLVLDGKKHVHALADAASNGGRWVVDLEAALAKGIKEGDKRALADWERIAAVARFYETHRRFREWADGGGLALVEDERMGALLSGGIMDMIVAKHIPVRTVKPDQLAEAPGLGLRMILNVDPSLLSEEQTGQVRAVARAGATLVNGPPGWKMTLPEGGSIVFGEEQLKQLDGIWREVNGLIGRRNFGMRVFGAPGMLSNLKVSADGRQAAVHLVNYTDYPVESITVQTTEKWASARLLTPRGERALELYAGDEGMAFDIDRVEDVAIIVLEAAQPKR